MPGPEISGESFTLLCLSHASKTQHQTKGFLRRYHVDSSTTTTMAGTEKITTISPSTNTPVRTRYGPSTAELTAIVKTSHQAFLSWRKTTLLERQKVVKRALELLNERRELLAKELTEQMGRPISYTEKEVTTAIARGTYMLKISSDVLKDTLGEEEQGFKRFIRKCPLGPVLVIFAWNVSRSFEYGTILYLTTCS